MSDPKRTRELIGLFINFLASEEIETVEKVLDKIEKILETKA